MDFNAPSAPKFPFMPTTEFNFNNATVVLGSSSLIAPDLTPATTSAGKASASTFNPTESAVVGLTPSPKPPLADPSIALSICNNPLQNSSSPKVSNLKIFLHSLTNGSE